MSSHYHLVVKAGAQPLEKLMKPLNVGLASAANYVRGRRVGKVFAGRYKAILVEEEAYLLELIRYVHHRQAA